MGIDGVGNGGIPKSPGASAPAGSGKDFDVGSGQPSVEAAGAAATDDTALAQVQRGELSVEDYLDTRVEAALEHLRGRLSAEQLAEIGAELRNQLQSDPALARLVQRTTGVAASDNEG